MYKTILHATDLNECHYDLCQKAMAYATDMAATFYLLHVIEIPSSFQLAQSLGFAELITPDKEQATMVINTIGRALNIPKQNQLVETGSAYHHILTKIKQLHCDLVILGRHNAGSLPAFLGSTANSVVRHAECDVLTLYPTV